MISNTVYLELAITSYPGWEVGVTLATVFISASNLSATYNPAFTPRSDETIVMIQLPVMWYCFSCQWTIEAVLINTILITLEFCESIVRYGLWTIVCIGSCLNSFSLSLIIFYCEVVVRWAKDSSEKIFPTYLRLISRENDWVVMYPEVYHRCHGQ